MISGTISNFMHLGEMIDEEWVVKLMDAEIESAFTALRPHVCGTCDTWRHVGAVILRW